ncbi:MAG: hypothetical protein ACSW8I_01550 [bacterium]
MRKVYSFDVFDTCLSRLCGSPENLFEVLSIDVLKKMNILPTDNEHIRQLFIAARRDCGGTLKEIYEQVGKTFPLPCPVDEMVQMEMTVESQMLRPIRQTLRLIESFREKGDIIFISDMYLPTSFIQKILVKYNFFKDGDLLFVSDEVGAWKRDGSLYRFIHNQIGVPYRKWIHYGDNIKSDVWVPRKLGIHAHHISYKYLPYEQRWVNTPSFHYQYASIVAGISRSIRLMDEEQSTQRNFVCDIVAPLLVSRVVRIMNDVQKHNIHNIFFCARDCHSEYLISKCLVQAIPQIIPHYLFFSRDSRDRDSHLLLKYLEQEGVASSEGSALVDISTNGDTLRIINSLITKDGFKACLGYYLLYLNIYKNAPHKPNRLVKSDIMNLYTNTLPHKCGKKATNTLFPEHLFSLNLHKKTIGYTEHHGKILPLFGDDDNNGLTIPNYKKYKRINDSILQEWSEAFIYTNCIYYAEDVFHYIGLPSYFQFQTSPQKEYVGWLKGIKRNGYPIVRQLSPFNILKIGHSWPQGCIAESLPPKTGQLIIRLTNSPRLHRIIKEKIAFTQLH